MSNIIDIISPSQYDALPENQQKYYRSLKSYGQDNITIWAYKREQVSSANPDAVIIKVTSPAPIPKMKVYKNVVVDRTHPGIKFPETVPCYANFDYSNPIGVAKLQSNGISTIWADICLFEDKWNGFYPALALKWDGSPRCGDGTVFALGICSGPNVDGSIEPLSEPIAKPHIKCICTEAIAFGCFFKCDIKCMPTPSDNS